MLTSIKRYWTALPASIAGPAFIAAGVLFAISNTFEFIPHPVKDNVVGYLLAFLRYLLDRLIPTAANLAVLAGLAAIYKRWAMVLDSLGRLELLLAAIGVAVEMIGDAEWVVGDLINLLFTGTSGDWAAGIENFIVESVQVGHQATIYLLWGGMVLIGIYLLRAKANLLPSWAKFLPFIIGLWGFLKHFIYSTLNSIILSGNMPENTMYTWSLRLDFLLGLLQIILWVLLGIALLSKQPVLLVQTEPPLDTGEIAVSN